SAPPHSRFSPLAFSASGHLVVSVIAPAAQAGKQNYDRFRQNSGFLGCQRTNQDQGGLLAAALGKGFGQISNCAAQERLVRMTDSLGQKGGRVGRKPVVQQPRN